MKTSRQTISVCLCVAGWTALLAAATPAMQRTADGPTTSGEFQKLLSSYRQTDGVREVEAFARWPLSRIEREATLPTDADAWTRAALAMLHMETGLAKGTFGGLRPDLGVITGAHDELEIHVRLATTIVDDLMNTAVHRRDVALLQFCRSWYALGLLLAPNELQARMNVRDFLSDDPAHLLLKARFHEYWMGPEICCAVVEFLEQANPAFPRTSTSHGRFEQRNWRKAEGLFRQVAMLIPDSIEARVRLGRLLYLLDRDAEAARELEQALADSRSDDEPGFKYLAALFLGRLNEDGQRFGEAAERYHQAIAALPNSQAAYLSLGRLQVSSGDPAGWATVRRALSADATDQADPLGPWYGYRVRQRPWRTAERIRELRAMVRQSGS